MGSMLVSKIQEKTIEAINRFGNYLGLDLKYYIKNSAYLLAEYVVTTAFGALLSIALARVLTLRVYGEYNFLMSILGILAIFTLPAMNSSMVQAISRGYDGVLSTGTKERLKWSTIGTVTILGLGVYYYLSGSVLLGVCLMCSSIIFPFYNSFVSYRTLFTAKRRFNEAAKYGAITHLIAIPITILVTYLTGNLVLIIIAYFASFSLLRGYLYRVASRNMQNKDIDKEAIPFGRHLTVTEIPGIIAEHYDKLIIALFLSFPEVAVYSVALVFSNLLNPLRSVIPSLIFPKLSQMDRDTAYAEVKKRWPFVTLGFAIVCGILILLCPYVIPLLYSQKYVSSISYAQLLLISIILTAPLPIFNKALFLSQKELGKLYKVRIFHAVVEITLMTALTWTMGILGAVIAKMLTRFFLFLYELRLIRES